MIVTLFVPCFVDLLYPRVAISMVQILERLGHQVAYPEELTCCGQPAFNSGYWDEARTVAVKVLHRLRDAEVVVIASGSCGAMLKVFYPELFAKTEYALAAKVTFHDGCHGLRELGKKTPPRELLAQVRGLTLVEMKDAEICCGFGGTFSAKFPMISTAMAEVKCASAEETGADFIVSNDSSCLMQIQGVLDRQGSRVKTIHLAE